MECFTGDFQSVQFQSSAIMPMWWKPSTKSKKIMRLADFIGFEMSLVPQVENVFIHRIEDSARDIRVLVIVNDRDPKVRTDIYKREQAIMDELPFSEFDFHIIARENRPLSDIVTDAGEVALDRSR